MNASIENRLAALEAVTAPKEPLTMIISFPSADGAEQPEKVRAHGIWGNDWALDREPGETAEGFIERAKAHAVARRNEWGVSVMILETAEQIETFANNAAARQIAKAAV